MTATFKRIIIAAVALIAIAGAACALVMSCGHSTADGPINQMRNGAVNTVLDLTGIKGRLDSELRSRAGEVAERMGVSQAVANSIVDSLAIEEWQAVTLPPSAKRSGSFNVEAQGISAQVTTYDDPSVITVEAFGQAITFEVPESARTYMPFLKYLENV